MSGSDPRLVFPSAGRLNGSGGFCLYGLGLSGDFRRVDIQADATGRLHHRRAPRRNGRVLCLCEGRKWLGEELVAKGDDLFLAHGGKCHRLLRKAELFTKDFEQPCLFEPVEQRRVRRPMRANVGHHLDLEVMH